MPSEEREPEPLHRSLGLTDDELDRIVELLGRAPNRLELAMYAVMWSEHCSYKSSRLHLRRLPTEGPRVLVGPGENAGVVDAGDGIAVAIRIESHNHPSAIEPHQGAATGVGGILRDVFTMGARPLALMDPLFFGPLDDARQRWLVEGVVSGISSYGNSVGVPTVGGELTFDPCFAQNPLVNVLCLGALPAERLVLGRASGPGNLVVLLGATTGRDGIGGVSVLASAGFDGAPGGAPDDDAKRPSVQVGDPFEEKRLIEACLSLLDAGLVVGIQDLGGAGLACAASETATRGGVGMDLDVTAVPRREPDMAPWEVMTSESQERMLAVVAPEDWPAVAEVCDRWEVRATVVGRVTEPEPPGTAAGGTPPAGPGGSGADRGGPVGRLRVRDGIDGPVLADVPAASLTEGAPLYDRPMAPPPDLERRTAEDPGALEAPGDCGADLLSLLVDPAWVWRQYDHQLFLNTVVGPGGDAALLRLAGPGLPPSDAGVAVVTDSSPRWCALDPRRGTALVLAESTANLACVGATPVAVVNCLNFGNPEHPEVMWQLSEAIDGLGEACRALGLPVIGGNVSLYNESGGADIDPAPVLGVLGLVPVLRQRPPGMGWRRGDALVVLGARRAAGAQPYPLGASRWAVEVRNHRHGRLPELDLAAHRRVTAFVAGLVADAVGGGDSLLAGVHDVSGGGLALALAEMADVAGCGCVVEGIEGHAELFTELPSRIVAATADPAALLAAARAAGVPAQVVGRAGGDRLVVAGLVDLPLAAVREARAEALPVALDRAG
ncbi:MAG TPA: phosphoribosylformylglycinamidine synthase subunit PurL [Acidimicrobiales bacterium]|nr:phosphoribosylformylglycinamidine synthase subunit PurL [Acidimicrobiales bacterium]